MTIEPIPKQGTTPSRKRFWDAVRDALIASQKVAGRNATVDEYPGKGSVINFEREPTTPVTPTGACCIGEECAILTEAECIADDGIYQGDGTTCDPNPCVVECCEVSSIQLQVRLFGDVDDGDCLTFDCSIDHTFTSPEDFNSDPCSGNQDIFYNDIDNSDCITCTDGITTPTGTTDYSISIFPEAGPAKIQVCVDPSYVCDTCGLNTGGANFCVIADWHTTNTCPIGVYTWSGDASVAGVTLNYEITLTVS